MQRYLVAGAEERTHRGPAPQRPRGLIRVGLRANIYPFHYYPGKVIPNAVGGEKFRGIAGLESVP